ncbi:hypothetical protein B0H11DRAFT_1899464 [Mycena galericulata]|nr:hypothetical protein B0H11DRAFT_1899464 [Mycena galericulata]
MDTLFYLVLSRGQKPMTVGLINQALRIYKKAPVHNSIRTWADDWGVFSHLDAEVVIQKIADIITENSVKPERWEMKADSAEETSPTCISNNRRPGRGHPNLEHKEDVEVRFETLGGYVAGLDRYVWREACSRELRKATGAMGCAIQCRKAGEQRPTALLGVSQFAAN